MISVFPLSAHVFLHGRRSRVVAIMLHRELFSSVFEPREKEEG